MKKVVFFIFAFFIVSPTIHSRSPFRKKDKDLPKITIGWKHSKKTISLSNWVLTEYPIFNVFSGAGREYFYKHLLPLDYIHGVNNSEKLFNCNKLNVCIEHLLKEIKKHKKEYTHFIVLQDKNFNYKQRCGLLVLQFKNYPFVLKLFMETPKSFIDPYCKGFENQFFFYMSGGMNRHIAGLTRVKNLELVNQQIHDHPRWNSKVKTPRKWYWLPQRHRWMKINGYNIGGKKEITTLMPSTYAIIADTIDTKEDAPLLSSQQKSELIMELCMDLHLFVDPHADNFVIKHQKDTNEYFLSIVDTEHFPSIVGLKEEPFFTNHLEWFLYLGAKYFQDAFLQTKNDRRNAQYKINPCALKW
jgi:hypothetical protein